MIWRTLSKSIETSFLGTASSISDVTSAGRSTSSLQDQHDNPVNTNNRNEIYCFMILCYSRLIHHFISYTYTMDPDLTPPH